MNSSIDRKQELICTLREHVSDIHRKEFEDDHYIEKWLVARDWDLKKAEFMLRNHIKWRIAEDIDNLLTTYKIPEVFEKFGVGSFFGHDKEGRPIWWEHLGGLDPQGFLKSLHRNDILKSRLYAVEHLLVNLLPKRSLEEGRPISQTIAVFDMENFGRKHLWKPSMDVVIEATKLMEDNYPESMAKLIIFNAPSLFKIAFRIVKPFLAPATQNKVAILGGNFKEELSKLIDKDQLPAYLGGNVYGPDGDPKCTHAIKLGGTVPCEYYLNKHKQEMQNVCIKARSKFKMSYFVPQSDSVVYYEFSSREGDINFGIFYIGEKLTSDVHKLKSSHCVEVIKLNRVKCNLTIEKGEISSLDCGYYLIEFDNSYSWATSKHMQYHIEVLDVIKN